MLRLMLNCHSRLCVPFESVFITQLYKRLPEFGDLSREDNLTRLLAEISSHHFVIKGNLLPDPHLVMKLQPTTYPEVIDAMFSVLAIRDVKPRWGDKTPSYVSEMDVLWKLFPNAKFIHLVRDGRDVALSLKRVSWGGNHLPRNAEDWRRKTELAHKMGAMIPGNFLEARYEDLVRDTEAVLRRICAFLGETFEPQMLRHYEGAKDCMPPQSLQWHASSISQVDEQKVYEWKSKMPPTDRVIFEGIAGEALDLFGYEREGRPSTWISRLRKLMYYLAT